jgi:hypothetical protein
MRYCVHVENAQATRTQLEFVLDQNPLVDLWLECLRAQYTSTAIDHFSGTSSFTTLDTLADAQAAVEHSRHALGLDPSLDVNALHLLFHHCYQDHTPGDPQWDLLNRRIHHLEEQERNLAKANTKKTGFNCVVIDAASKFTQQRPIPPELRSYWAHQPRSGELFLGYYTIGKTIYNCFKDLDLECVRQGMVRQQQQVSTEALCYWGHYGRSLSPAGQQQANKVIHQQIVSWLAAHGLESSIDLDLLENQYHVQPRLGEYAGSLTLEEINSVLFGSKIVLTELLD